MKQAKHFGSEVFGTNVIKTDEYVLMASVMMDNGSESVEQAALEIEAIDDMLSMQKVRIIHNAMRFTATGRLRKDASFSDFLSKRIDKLKDDLKGLEN